MASEKEAAPTTVVSDSPTCVYIYIYIYIYIFLPRNGFGSGPGIIQTRAGSDPYTYLILKKKNFKTPYPRYKYTLNSALSITRCSSSLSSLTHTSKLCNT